MEQVRERAASIAILTSIPMVAQLVAGRAVRDALFLTEYEAVYLPRVMLAAAVLSLGAAVMVGRLMPRWGPRATALGLALLNGAIFVLEAALLDAFPGVVAVLAYVHVSTLGALVISAFSSVVNERFDPLYAKTVVAQVGIGATLGGVLGGLLALVLSNYADLSTLLYSLGGIELLVAAGIWSIGGSTQPRRTSDESARFGIQTLRNDPYLRRLALTVMLLGTVGVLVDYAMKAEADARFSDSAGLLSFFAVFYLVTSILTFVTQAGVARPLLAKIGLGGTMAILPLTVAVSAGLGAFWTKLWSTALARGSQTVLSSSLFRSGYELLYTPMSPMKKRATKALVDVACNRIGYGIGSLAVMAIVAIAASPELATSWVLVAAALTALLSTWLVRQLHEGYVRELATSLREGSIALRTDEIIDATTLHTLAKTGTAMNRHELLESIEQYERERGAREYSPRVDAWVAQLSDLVSGEPPRVLAVLLDESLDPRFAGAVIDLLGDDVFARPAYQALERLGGRITGQLVDALLWDGTAATVRRRIPRLLRKSADPRAVQGLVVGLEDREFEVRYRCGHALVRVRNENPDIIVERAAIMKALENEVAREEQHGLRAELREEVPDDIRVEIDTLLAEREDRNLEHLFTLLSLALERDAVVLSLRALSSSNENLRGTALEYLYNVLPEPVRGPLWPRLTERSERMRPRTTQSSPDELLTSMRTLMRDRVDSPR